MIHKIVCILAFIVFGFVSRTLAGEACPDAYNTPRPGNSALCTTLIGSGKGNAVAEPVWSTAPEPDPNDVSMSDKRCPGCDIAMYAHPCELIEFCQITNNSMKVECAEVKNLPICNSSALFSNTKVKGRQPLKLRKNKQ